MQKGGTTLIKAAIFRSRVWTLRTKQPVFKYFRAVKGKELQVKTNGFMTEWTVNVTPIFRKGKKDYRSIGFTSIPLNVMDL